MKLERTNKFKKKLEEEIIKEFFGKEKDEKK